MWHSGDDRLTVTVDLMAEPCLWRWEIRDPKRDEVVASSWTDEWMAYESPEEALRAAGVRLDSMSRSSRIRARSARSTRLRRPRRVSVRRVLLIPPRRGV